MDILFDFDLRRCIHNVRFEGLDGTEPVTSVKDALLYVQECRSSLERCIGSGAARLRYRWRDGRVTETRFRRVSPGRVRVSGLLAGPALRAAG